MESFYGSDAAMAKFPRSIQQRHPKSRALSTALETLTTHKDQLWDGKHGYSRVRLSSEPTRVCSSAHAPGEPAHPEFPGLARSTTIVTFATRADIAPTAAMTGARITPTAATLTGISTNVIAVYFFDDDPLNVGLMN
jgi:hypothetical protein